MTITATYANADNTLVAFTVGGVTRTVPADWKGEFRDGIGGVVGFLERGGIIEAYVAPPPTIDDVRHEARRRIEVIMPEQEQRHVMGVEIEAIQNHGTSTTLWPSALKAITDAARAKRAKISAVRARADEITAMSPIPADYASDSRWPA